MDTAALGYVVALYCMALSFQHMPLSIAYAIW
ncbi:hypothetical protein IQ267_01570 [filamentous cyanobacterium LEGE 07170]|nr:hypothetical protein [filamentous cyanobacterium LEGE 07170]